MAGMKMDPDFAAYVAAHPSPPAASPQGDDDKTPITPAIAARNIFNASVTSYVAKFLPVSDLVKETKHTIKSYDGQEITVHEFARTDLPDYSAEKPSPAILSLHGGGLVACPVDTVCRPSVAQFALDFRVRTFAVEFRLAPEHPYPAPLEDCYAALKWLTESSSALNVDPARIGVLGPSGGATLAAGVSLLARDRGHSPPIAKQFLIYPMLDDRSSKIHFNPESERDRSLSGVIGILDAGWAAYLDNEDIKGTGEVPGYAVPAREVDLKGLPATYMDIGGLDWFRAETLEFAARLAKADVDVEMHLYAGLPHCFDLIAPGIPASENAKENRRRAINGL